MLSTGDENKTWTDSTAFRVADFEGSVRDTNRGHPDLRSPSAMKMLGSGCEAVHASLRGAKAFLV